MYLRVLLLGLMLFSSPAFAQDEPVPEGHRSIDLLRDCQSESRVRLHCYGYISGMDDMHSMMSGLRGGRRFYCFPELSITGEQAIRIFVKWAEEHPEQLHESRRLGVISAFAGAFPCN